MALADDLRALADRSLAALHEGHDYFAFSKRAWKLLQKDIEKGRKLSLHNPATGTKVDEEVLHSLAPHYVAEYPRTAVFQHFVSLFEDFVLDLLRRWLAAYPGSLAKKQIEFGMVLQAPDKTALTFAVVDRELNELKYERVGEWFAYLERLAKLGCPTSAEANRLAEIKASRDILAHNKGIANAIYVAKAGKLTRCKDGELLEIPEQYLRESWETIRKVIRDVAAAAVKKAEGAKP
jgi:hypothetical protein